MSSIVITYWEGDESKSAPFTKITYAEWEAAGQSHYGHADVAKFNYGEEAPEDMDTIEDGRGHVEHRGIPEDVREAIAFAVAPHLAPEALHYDRVVHAAREIACARSDDAWTALTATERAEYVTKAQTVYRAILGL